MRLPVRPVLVLALFAGFAGLAPAGVLPQPTEAPEWEISEWINEDPGSLAEQRGKVVLIDFFQLWCPGCNQFSVPLFQRWQERFWGREDVLVLSIHTVFEGHAYQTPERLREFVHEKGILHPVGIDAYDPADPETPTTMKRFRTGGTPHVSIIDRQGRLRFHHFGSFDPEVVEAFIDRLLEEPSEPGNDEPSRARSRAPESDRARKTEKRKPRESSNDTERDDKQAPLSGRYTMTFEQTLKSCGPEISPIETSVDLKVLQNKIEARFARSFLGLRQLSAEFDAEQGTFEAETQQRVRLRGARGTVRLELEGKFVNRDDAPELEFTVEVYKEGDERGWECSIKGRGTAKKR